MRYGSRTLTIHMYTVNTICIHIVYIAWYTTMIYDYSHVMFLQQTWCLDLGNLR